MNIICSPPGVWEWPAESFCGRQRCRGKLDVFGEVRSVSRGAEPDRSAGPGSDILWSLQGDHTRPGASGVVRRLLHAVSGDPTHTEGPQRRQQQYCFSSWRSESVASPVLSVFIWTALLTSANEFCFLQIRERASSVTDVGKCSLTDITETNTWNTHAASTRGTGSFPVTYAADPSRRGTGWGSTFCMCTKNTDLTR